MKKHIKALSRTEVSRYIINGLVATAIHYSVLTFNIEIAGMQSAGLANMIAAVFGISSSFLGSRYYVFKRQHDPISDQAAKFVLLYAFIACLHGLVLYAWTDVYKLDYRAGFIMATFLQVAISYLGNKFLVFKT